MREPPAHRAEKEVLDVGEDVRGLPGRARRRERTGQLRVRERGHKGHGQRKHENTPQTTRHGVLLTLVDHSRHCAAFLNSPESGGSNRP